jgi:hypothetical protein
MSWYHAADSLTQDVVMLASFIAIFLLSTFVVLSRSTK